MTKHWTLSIMEVGQNYELDFPNGGKVKSKLVKKSSSFMGNDYIFEPLTPADRVFGEHENWQILGWDSPWWFPLPETLIYNADPRPLSESGLPLTDRQIDYMIMLMKCNTLNEFPINDLKNNTTRASAQASKLMDLVTEMGFRGTEAQPAIDAINGFTDKLKQVQLSLGG